MQELEGQIAHRVNEHNTPHYDIAQPLPRLFDVEQGRRMTMFTAKAQENVSRVQVFSSAARCTVFFVVELDACGFSCVVVECHLRNYTAPCGKRQVKLHTL